MPWSANSYRERHNKKPFAAGGQEGGRAGRRDDQGRRSRGRRDRDGKQARQQDARGETVRQEGLSHGQIQKVDVEGVYEFAWPIRGRGPASRDVDGRIREKRACAGLVFRRRG